MTLERNTSSARDSSATATLDTAAMQTRRGRPRVDLRILANAPTQPEGMALRLLSHEEPTEADLAYKAALEADDRDKYVMAYLATSKKLEQLERRLGTLPSQATTIDNLGLRSLGTISTAPPDPLLIERLDPEGHTILFGDGGIGKGTLASSWILQLARADRRVLILDYENHPEEWARRTFGLGATEEIRADIGHIAPLTPHWHGPSGAIWDHQEHLRAIIEEHGYDCVVVDSIVPACGATNPSDPEAASQYAAAIEYLGVPTLSLAHVNRAKDYSKPFGSAFWHNLARMTWSMEKEGDLVLMKSRKANNYRRAAAQTIEVFWNEQGLPIQVDERAYQQTLASRIHETLTDGPMIVSQIAAVLNDAVADEEKKISTNNIRSALNRSEGADGLFIKLDTSKEPHWARSDHESEA